MTDKAAATIGVYGWTLERFLAALHAANVRVVLDVRQRRGVRGPEYAWANSARLQAALAKAGIEYRHHKELAPTTDLRNVQYQEDTREGVGKRSRMELAPEYRVRYQLEVLDRVDLGELVSNLAGRRSRGAALRRTRSRGLPSLADHRASRSRVRRVGRPPTSLMQTGQRGARRLGRALGPADVVFTTTESRSTGRSR